MDSLAETDEFEFDELLLGNGGATLRPGIRNFGSPIPENGGEKGLTQPYFFDAAMALLVDLNRIHLCARCAKNHDDNMTIFTLCYSLSVQIRNSISRSSAEGNFPSF